MSIAAAEALPLSKKALKSIVDSHTWEASAQELRAASTSRAWQVASASVVLALLGWGMAGFQATRPIPEPVIVVVDRTTGETLVAPRFDQNAVPQISAVDQHWAAVYVRAHEGYFYNLLKRDYDQVARMSTPEVFAPYSAQFAGNSAMQTKLGTTQEHDITLVSVRMSGTTKPGRTGEAIVTFDKEVKSSQGIQPVTTRYVATVRFEYRPSAMKKHIDRVENPLGFVVLAYRADPELLTPGTAPAGATNNATTPSSGTPS